jgi:hypothetical protein
VLIIQTKRQKQIEKKYFRNYDKKTISDQPLGVLPNIFSHSQCKHIAEERLKKKSSEKSYSPLKIGHHFEFPAPF